MPRTIAITPDQEGTLKSFGETMILDTGERMYYFPYYLIRCENGLFESRTFDALPENAKDQLLKLKGIK